MASLINALRSLIPGLDSDHLIGVLFHPTFEQGIRIVKRKNEGQALLPIFKEVDDLFRRPPDPLEECYCFTKLEPLGKNKVNRTLRDGSDRRYWKNITPKDVVVNNVIGCVTKLKLHENKNTPTEWHILEYRDRKTPDAGRWVLCKIYKREKNNGSDSSGRIDPYTDNTIVPDPLESDVRAGQFHPSTSQDSSMWDSGGGATYRHPTGGHMNQDQFHGVDQSLYTPQVGMVYNSQQFLPSPNPFDDIDMGLLGDEFINQLLSEF